MSNENKIVVTDANLARARVEGEKAGWEEAWEAIKGDPIEAARQAGIRKGKGAVRAVFNEMCGFSAARTAQLKAEARAEMERRIAAHARDVASGDVALDA